MAVLAPAGGGAADGERRPDGGSEEPPRRGIRGAIDRGHELYKERCSFCHGTLARGAKGPCLTCGRFLYRGGSDAQLFATISGGIPSGQMGAFSSLGGEDIQRIIAFLRDETRRQRPEAAGHSGDGGRDDSRYIEPVPGGADSDD